VNKWIRSVPSDASDRRQEDPRPGQGEAVADGRAWLYAGLGVAAVGWGAQEFTPLLLLYQTRLDLSTTVIQATFVVYVVGLIPGLLLGGPFSDRYGRRRVMAPTMIASALATVLLIVGGTGSEIGWVFVGRLVAGIASGAGFSAGAAWIKELSASGSSAGVNHGPRRVTVAMGIGFALGPLVAGVLAQWAPYPFVLPYLPHLVLAGVAFFLVLRARETRTPSSRTNLLQYLRIDEVRGRRFRTVVVPLAPWVFISVSVAVAYLPGLVKTHIASYPLIFSAVVVAVNAGAGIFVQPVARRMDHPSKSHLLGTALAIVVVGMLIAAAAAATVQPALVIVASLVLGAGYGCCQVYGLLEVHRLARPEHLAGLTATYQAISYVGFAASYPLAAMGAVVPASVLLVAVAVLAALTLAWTTRASKLTSPSSGQPGKDAALLSAGGDG
jgi:MFS family permease